MTRINDWLWQRVSRSASPVEHGFGVLRILAGIFLLTWELPTVSWLADVPPAFFNPPVLSLAALFNGFPPPVVVRIADVVLVGLVCLIAAGIRARACTLLLCVVGLLFRSFQYSFGKIDHDAMLWLFLGCMAFSGWGRTLAIVPDRPSRFDSPERGSALLAVGLAFGMFSAGFQKALYWVDFDPSTSGFLSWFYPGYYGLGRTHLLASFVAGWPSWLTEGLDYGAVVFEWSGLVALVAGPLAWRGWLLVACVFHLSNTLLLNIAFDIHVLVILAFSDLSGVHARLARLRNALVARRAALAALVGLGVGALASHSRPIWYHVVEPASAASYELTLWLSVLLWGGVIITHIRGMQDGAHPIRSRYESDP